MDFANQMVSDFVATRSCGYSMRVPRLAMLCQDSERQAKDEEHGGRQVVPQPQGNMCSNNLFPIYIPLRRGDRLLHLQWLELLWNINFASIFHVAFYAWSAVEVKEILFELAKRCPNLQSITIGYTVLQDMASQTIQDLLWCGVDYPSKVRSHRRVTPDLTFFAKMFQRSAARNRGYCLKDSEIPRYDEIMLPWAANDPDGGLTSLHEFFRHRKNGPTIRVVNVPLIPSDNLPDRDNVARKLRFLSPADEWAKESSFATRKSRDSVVGNMNSYERRARMVTESTRTCELTV